MSGGIKVATIYAKALVNKGHEVVLISPPPKQMSVRTKIKSYLLGKGWPPSTPNLQSHLDNSGLDHRVINRWRPITNRDVPDADIVIATWWETAEWVSMLGPEKGAKAYFVQGHEVFSHLPIDRVKATYRMPFHRIVVSKWLKTIMEREYGDLSTDLVPNSIDHQQFYAPIRGKQIDPTVGFLYSRSSSKGVEVSLKIIRLIRDKFPTLRVISFGAVPLDRDNGWDQRIEFEHSPAQNRIRELYAQCDVWISSSRSEGFNLTAMEAMACRTPVVSTRTGWPEEAIKTHENGVLVEVDDAEGLATGAMWALSLSDAMWRTVSQNAFSTTSASSWETSANLFEQSLMHCRARTLRGELH